MGKAITVLSVIITTGVISTVTIIEEKATSAITTISVSKRNQHAILHYIIIYHYTLTQGQVNITS